MLCACLFATTKNITLTQINTHEILRAMEDQIINPQQTSPDVINQPQTHTALKKILFLFISIFVIIGSIAAGSYFYKLKHPVNTTSNNNENPLPQAMNPKMPQANTNAAQQATTTTSTNPSMNIYQNNANKFSVPYPKGLTVKEAPYGLGITSIEMRAPNKPANYPADYQMLLFPKTLGTMIGQDFNSFYTMTENTSKIIKDPSGASTKFTKGSNKTINGLRAFEFSSTSEPADPQEEPEIGVYIETGNSITIISTGESNRVTLESMVSQFKYPL